MNDGQPNILDVLRQRAEQLISGGNSLDHDQHKSEVKRIFHELQIHQLELEMQNDELQTATYQLEEQKDKFTNLFELAPVGYFVTSKTGVIEDVNNAALKLIGANKSDLLGKPMLLYIHKEDTDIFYRYFRSLFIIQKAQSCQIRICSAQGQVFNVQIEGIALNAASLNPVCYLTITDFTGKQQAEEKLQEAKRTLEIALDASLTGIWEIDTISGKVFLDQFCCGLYGFYDNSFDQRYESVLRKIYYIDRNKFDDKIRKAIIFEKEFNFKFRIQVNGEARRYILGRAQIIKDRDNKKRFTGTFTDISEKTIIEMEANGIKLGQQQMILAAGLQAEENEKKRISEVLHDGIAQMLYAIKLDLDQMKSQVAAPAFDHINQLLNRSIRDIRNISFELAPSILTDFGLAVTLEDMAARLSSPTLKVLTHVAKMDKTVDFQLQLNIFRIIQELVNNSIKHASATIINIELTGRNKNNIVIQVSDNGKGYKPEQKQQTPKGIGLSSIKNRLRLYKGTLKIESNKQQPGTLVCICLKY